MIDICENKGIIIDYKKLSKDLDVEVIFIIVGKNIGIDKIKERLQKENFNVFDDCDKFNFFFEKDVYKFIESILRDSFKEKENNNEFFIEKLDKYVLYLVFVYLIFIVLMLLMF